MTIKCTVVAVAVVYVVLTTTMGSEDEMCLVDEGADRLQYIKAAIDMSLSLNHQNREEIKKLASVDDTIKSQIHS